MILNRILQTGKNLATIGSKTAANLIKTAANDQPQTPVESISKETPPTSTVSSIKENMLRQASLKGKSFLSDSLAAATTLHSQWIPSLQFKAVGSDKTIDLKKLSSPAVVFISHKENAENAANLNRMLIEKYFPAEIPFFTANIILLDEIPSFARSIVSRELKKAYNTILRDWLKDPALAEKWIHILPDWENRSIDSFRLHDERPLLSSVVLAPYGRVQTIINNPTPFEDIAQVLSPWVTI